MGCRSSQKKFQRYRPKIEVWGKIFVFALLPKVPIFGPKKMALRVAKSKCQWDTLIGIFEVSLAT